MDRFEGGMWGLGFGDGDECRVMILQPRGS